MMTGGASKPSTSKPHSSLMDGFMGPSRRVIPRPRAQVRHRSEQEPAHGRVVDRLEEAEEGGGLIVPRVVVLVHDAGDAPHVTAVPAHHPQGQAGVGEEGVLRPEHLTAVAQQRGYPVRIASIDAVGDAQEAPETRRVAREFLEAQRGRHGGSTK